MKITPVEFLVRELKIKDLDLNDSLSHIKLIVDQALEMERNHEKNPRNIEEDSAWNNTEWGESEKYFWTKGFQSGISKIPEISDDDIMEAIEVLPKESYITRRAFELGAKWYREQLKQRK